MYSHGESVWSEFLKTMGPIRWAYVRKLTLSKGLRNWKHGCWCLNSRRMAIYISLPILRKSHVRHNCMTNRRRTTARPLYHPPTHFSNRRDFGGAILDFYVPAKDWMNPQIRDVIVWGRSLASGWVTRKSCLPHRFAQPVHQGCAVPRAPSDICFTDAMASRPQFTKHHATRRRRFDHAVITRLAKYLDWVALFQFYQPTFLRLDFMLPDEKPGQLYKRPLSEEDVPVAKESAFLWTQYLKTLNLNFPLNASFSPPYTDLQPILIQASGRSRTSRDGILSEGLINLWRDWAIYELPDSPPYSFTQAELRYYVEEGTGRDGNLDFISGIRDAIANGQVRAEEFHENVWRNQSAVDHGNERTSKGRRKRRCTRLGTVFAVSISAVFIRGCGLQLRNSEGSKSIAFFLTP